jgi:hypothetical protein
VKNTEAVRNLLVGARSRRARGIDMPAQAPQGGAPAARSARSLWLWVLGGFLVLGACWFVMFKVAHTAQIREVPLATKGGGP